MSRGHILNFGADLPPAFKGKLPHPVATNRQAWRISPGDVVASANPPDHRFLEYVADATGANVTDVAWLEAPAICSDDSFAVGYATELGALGDALRERRAKTVEMSYATRSLAQFCREHSLNSHARFPLAEQGSASFLNRKSTFRRIAAGANAPIPFGFIAESPREMMLTVREVAAATGNVILKQDCGAGGHGNVIFSTAATPLPGARETRFVDWSNPDWDPEQVWSELGGDIYGCVVVEEYWHASAMLYHEYWISSDGAVNFVNSGDIRVRPSVDGRHFDWLGLELPAMTEPYGAALEATATIVKQLALLGYRGPVNVDLIHTAAGVLLNEFNCRWGGGTVVDEFARRTLSDLQDAQLAIRWVREVPYVELATAVARLESAGLHASNMQRGTGGVWIASIAERAPASIELFVVAPRDELDAREQEARSALARLQPS